MKKIFLLFILLIAISTVSALQEVNSTCFTVMNIKDGENIIVGTSKNIIIECVQPTSVTTVKFTRADGTVAIDKHTHTSTADIIKIGFTKDDVNLQTISFTNQYSNNIQVRNFDVTVRERNFIDNIIDWFRKLFS